MHIPLTDELLDSPAKIDRYDRKILYELMIDARKPLAHIAKSVRLSQQVVHYRIRQLQKKGIITGFLAILDVSQLRMGVYRALFRLEHVDSRKEREILAYFARNPYVFWLARVGGRWDLIVDFVTKDIGHFYKILKESMNQFPENLKSRELLAFVDSFQYRRNFLVPGKRDHRVMYLGGVPEQHPVDRTDLQILKTLATNARMSNLRIGQELNLAANTVRLRIKVMEKNGLIQGYSAFIHPTVFGAKCAKILLTVPSFDDRKEQRLLDFGKFHPNVIFVEKVVGGWDFEYDVECNDEKEYRQLMREMRDKLSDIVVDYEPLPFYYDYSVNYFPWELSEFANE